MAVTTGITGIPENTCTTDALEKPSKRPQRALLGVSVALGILSLIPPLRFAGALALRSVSFLSASASCSSRWSSEGPAQSHFRWGSFDYDPIISKNAIAAKDIPLLPLTTTALATEL